MRLTIKLIALFMVIGLAGCATNKDLEAVKALAEQANATAGAALETARSAESTALDAKATADNTGNQIERMAKDQKKMHK